jgi:hypothetical protein
MSLLTELAKSIHLIHPLFQNSGVSGFSPLILIKAVNYFHSLGYHKSLEILQLYCYLLERIEERLTDILPNVDVDVKDFCVESYKIFTIARLIFVRKDREIVLPKLRLGQPDLQPKNLSLFPLYSLHLYQDIPLLLIKGYYAFRTSPIS